jgi:formamidopyrimidine-DNA glycosylase
MPELPEVQTTVDNLKKQIIGLSIQDVWSDWEKSIKGDTLSSFKEKIKNACFNNIERRAKMLIFHLSQDRILLAHQKMTGHFLVGKWHFVKNAKYKWQSSQKGPLSDKINDYIHLVFSLNNGYQLVLSDLRKFGWVKLYQHKKLSQIKELQKFGPEPLAENFSVRVLAQALKKTKKAIKKALMDQTIIAGIGNIYSDEVLFVSQIHPLTPANQIKGAKLEKLFRAIQKILNTAIAYHGTTILSGTEEFRLPSGERGQYQNKCYVYRKEGQPCPRCKIPLKRIKVGQRSAHFCPNCQKYEK